MHNIFSRSLFLVMLIVATLTAAAQKAYNLGFELQDASGKPADWYLAFGKMNAGYRVATDSIVKREGKYALSIEKVNDSGQYGVCSYSVMPPAKGNTIKLSGYIRTENVAAGYAGLWLRLDGATDMLAIDNMDGRGAKGTTGWKQYEAVLQFDAEKVKTIVVGALLTGSGKMWVDDLTVTINGKPIEKLTQKKEEIFKAALDTALNNVSGIASITLTPERITQLTNLGMLWGFLKYYHPAIARGNYNWDAELFRMLPKLLAATSSNDAYAVIEQWVDGLGKVPVCKKCKPLADSSVKYKADYGNLFVAGNLPASLVKKLAFIRDNYEVSRLHYYVTINDGIGNPEFRNEQQYAKHAYPDAGVRLLSLYRYWNMIQYFFPYKYAIGEDWNKVLSEFLPRFVMAKDDKEYVLACLEIIARIHDSHANIWSTPEVLNKLKGAYIVPLQAKFIEDKLMVTGYFTDDAAVKSQFKIGDIIEQIDGKPVADLIKQYLPVTPASNYDVQLRDLPSLNGFLLRSNDSVARLSVISNGVMRSVIVNRIKVVRSLYEMIPQGADAAYKILQGNIGYIYPALLKKNDIDDIKKQFANTKGLVIDLRCYPSTFMPFSYGEWLKSKRSPFVTFTGPDLQHPGVIHKINTIENGAKHEGYTHKIVIIANATTQSQAEYTIMALSTATDVTVIGSTTAGADGNVSAIRLPGGIMTWITGLGVYYPDGTETQRVGIKINEVVKPTIKGTAAGKDELLERALAIINER